MSDYKHGSDVVWRCVLFLFSLEEMRHAFSFLNRRRENGKTKQNRLNVQNAVIGPVLFISFLPHVVMFVIDVNPTAADERKDETHERIDNNEK